MNETCQNAQDFIALEGRAPETPELRDHVRECADCSAFLERALIVEQELSGLESADVSDDVIERLLARPELQEKPRPERTRQWGIGVAAAAIIGFVALSSTMMRYDAPSKRPSSSEDAIGGGLAGEAQEAAPPAARPAEPEPGRLARMNEALEESMRSLGDVGADRPAQGPPESFDDKNVGAYEEGAKEDLDALQAIENRLRIISPAETKLERAKRAAELEEDAQVKPSGVGGRLDVRVQDEEVVVSAESPRVENAPPEPASPQRRDERDAVGLVEGQSSAAPTDSLEVYGPEPEKRIHVEPEFPEGEDAVAGSVVMRLIVDRAGNVRDLTVLQSVPGLDEAVIQAVTQWKYVPSDRDRPPFRVTVTVPSPQEDSNAALSAFLEERERIEGLVFQEPRGYWANTYVPGDPGLRRLTMRLRSQSFPFTLHEAARPVAQPFDAPTRSALALTLESDRPSVDGPSRLLVQLGIQATEAHGRRRPPMNLGVVLDAGATDDASLRALLESLQDSKSLGDRFRLVVAGAGEVVTPDSFRHGPLRVAVDERPAAGSLAEALAVALERVHAGDDPSLPLGSSLVVVVTPRALGAEVEALARLAHRSAVGGVPVSVVGVGPSVVKPELERLALAGQGRRYHLDRSEDASGIVGRELSASSRTVARAVRLRIKLAEGVRLVDVVGSRRLDARQADAVREAEKAIDLRLSKNLGIESDRGDDEDGIQIVIPSFYAGDSHVVLLDVVADGPGPVAEVTARYKDLAELRNTVAKASLALPRRAQTASPLERNVLVNLLAHRLGKSLDDAGERLGRGDRRGALTTLHEIRRLLAGFAKTEPKMRSDVALVSGYIELLSREMAPAATAYLADSLRMAGAVKLYPHSAFT